jgi:hypothetical protein
MGKYTVESRLHSDEYTESPPKIQITMGIIAPEIVSRHVHILQPEFN